MPGISSLPPVTIQGPAYVIAVTSLVIATRPGARVCIVTTVVGGMMMASFADVLFIAPLLVISQSVHQDVRSMNTELLVS